MADSEAKRPIIVKRIKKGDGGHHGGAWKIAYADFVTAMMAFFLLMWLLGSTTSGDLNGIAEYFKTPLRVAMSGGSGAGASDSLITGGGRDLTMKSAQTRKTTEKVTKKERRNPRIVDLDAATKKNLAKEIEDLKKLMANIQAEIEANPHLAQYKNQLTLNITPDGLRIQIVDEKNRPMFAVSRSELEPYAKLILKDLGTMLTGIPNKIMISGHTDALPFPNGNKSYSNWELSAERANAARRELVAAGLPESSLLQVIGLSSAVPYDKKDPLNPINRRIAITVFNKAAEERVTREMESNPVSQSKEAASLLNDLKEDDAQPPPLK
jgi:chemotaxis protein MotB